MGVPLTKSPPLTTTLLFSISTLIIFTSDNPSALGRWGDRVAKSPRAPPERRGGRTLAAKEETRLLKVDDFDDVDLGMRWQSVYVNYLYVDLDMRWNSYQYIRDKYPIIK
jgi:hypothetical protein